jgi:hypothetical protein
MEDQRVDFNTQGCNILLLKFTRQVTLDKGGLAHPTVSDKDQFELGDISLSVMQCQTEHFLTKYEA